MIPSEFQNDPYTQHMTTGEKIKQLRSKKGWSQRDLAKETGLNSSIINRYEKDSAFPNGESLIKLCKALGISADYLLFENAPRTGRITIRDQELYEKFLLIEKMPEKDREAVKTLLTGLIVKNKLEDLVPELDIETESQKVVETRPLQKVAGKR